MNLRILSMTNKLKKKKVYLIKILSKIILKGNLKICLRMKAIRWKNFLIKLNLLLPKKVNKKKINYRNN